MIASVSNVGTRMALSDAQYLRFFESARLPMAAQRRNSVTGRWILFPALAMAHSVSMETTVGD